MKIWKRIGLELTEDLLNLIIYLSLTITPPHIWVLTLSLFGILFLTIIFLSVSSTDLLEKDDGH